MKFLIISKRCSNLYVIIFNHKKLPNFVKNFKHVFHYKCLDRWLVGKRNGKCPNCSARVIFNRFDQLEMHDEERMQTQINKQAIEIATNSETESTYHLKVIFLYIFLIDRIVQTSLLITLL